MVWVSIPWRRDGELDANVVDLLEGPDDEDNGDEGGEELLREPGAMTFQLTLNKLFKYEKIGQRGY